MALTARFMVAAVAFNSPAAMPTTTIATKACSSAEAFLRERQHDSARPGLFIGDHVGRYHRLAVARPRGVKDAVEEGQREQAPSGGAVGFGGSDEAGELTIELRLFDENPAEHTAHGRRQCLRA